MNIKFLIKYPAANLAFIGLVAFTVLAFTFEAPQRIEDIRMCALTNETDRCPTDNPVFEKGTSNITINIRSSALKTGDEVRFTWYRVDDSEFFSTYLDAVFEQVTASAFEDGVAMVTSNFPASAEVLPGNYEVVVYGPNDDDRPVIKPFKVLD